MRVRERPSRTIRQGWYGTETERFDTVTGEWQPYSFPKYVYQFAHHSAESITDVGGKFHKGVNPVSHIIQKAGVDGSENTDWVEQRLGSDRYRSRSMYGGYSNQCSVVVDQHGLPGGWLPASSLPHREAAEFLNEGGSDMQMSLANFLLELPEILTTLSFLRSKGLKKVSGGALSYNFGIAPLVGDLQTIASYTMNLQKRLEWLRKNAGKSVSVKFRKTLSKPTGYIPITSGMRWKITAWSHTYMGFGTWKVDYDPLEEPLTKLRYFNQYFGTSKILSAAWNAIPFSFVLDWVSNIGDLLRQFELPSALSSRLFDVGYSQKLDGKFELEYSLPNQWQRLGSYHYKRYERTPGMPLSLGSVVDITTMTGKQLGLALALIHQRW